MQNEFCFWGTFFIFFPLFYFFLSINSGMQSIKLLIHLTADRCDAVWTTVMGCCMLSFHWPLSPSAHLLTSEQGFPAFLQPDAAPFPKGVGWGGHWNVYRIHELDACFGTVFIIDTGLWNFTTVGFVCVCYIYNLCYRLMVWLYVWAYIMVTYF